MSSASKIETGNFCTLIVPGTNGVHKVFLLVRIAAGGLELQNRLSPKLNGSISATTETRLCADICWSWATWRLFLIMGDHSERGATLFGSLGAIGRLSPIQRHDQLRRHSTWHARPHTDESSLWRAFGGFHGALGLLCSNLRLL